MSQERSADMWPLVEALQREAGRGCAKAINVTVFIDRHGNIIGRSEFKTVKMLPGNVEELVRNMFSG